MCVWLLIRVYRGVLPLYRGVRHLYRGVIQSCTGGYVRCTGGYVKPIGFFHAQWAVPTLYNQAGYRTAVGILPGGRMSNIRASSAAGGSEFAYSKEGPIGSRGAGPGRDSKTNTCHNGCDGHTPPTPDEHKRHREWTTSDGVKASNKFVAVGNDSLQKSPNWYRTCYNRAIASWLRDCRLSHDKICKCGQFRSHWFQQCAGLEEKSTETEELLMRPLLEQGKRARRRLEYLEAVEKGKKRPYKKRRKVLRWADIPEDVWDGTIEENGDGDEDSQESELSEYEDVDFALVPEEDDLRDILRKGSSTPGPVRIL